MMIGSAALNAASAALRSPLWIASSTLRIEFRRSERRALFTSVRRAITRVALRADFVLAINLSFANDARGMSAKRQELQVVAAANDLAATREAYSYAMRGRQRPRFSRQATRLARTVSCPAITAARSAAENGVNG